MKLFFRNSFIIALLLHLLFFLSVSTILILQSEEEKKQEKLKVPAYVPSYVYTGTVSPPTKTQIAQKASASTSASTSSFQNKVNSQKTITASEKPQRERSVLEMSHDFLQNNQFQAEIQRNKAVEPMLLIGDMSEYADPLVKLIGRSLSANFRYPKMEGSFGVKGRVLVEMTLSPDGYFSDIRIVQSSDNQDFDAAALYAVNKAPLVRGADRILSAPKRLVVGFIFD